jgi:ribosomal protein S18 acetylase RimI-like enzyme
MQIRLATERDIRVIIDFQKRMALETENVTLDDSVLQLGVQNLFKDTSKGQYYVATENNETLGCLMTTYEWSDWRNGMVLWIQSVYVPKEHRGKGVYKALYLHIKELVQADKSLRGIRLYVDKTNKAAQQVYDKLGMNGEHYQVYEWMKG